MNITTNQNQLRPNVPGFFTLSLDAHITGTPLELDVNTEGDVIRYGWADSDDDFTKYAIDPEIKATITEILADIRKSFTWIAYCEHTLGGQMADPFVALRQPIGHWCFVDAKAGTVVLRENRSELDAAGCGVTA